MKITLKQSKTKYNKMKRQLSEKLHCIWYTEIKAIPYPLSEPALTLVLWMVGQVEKYPPKDGCEQPPELLDMLGDTTKGELSMLMQIRFLIS